MACELFRKSFVACQTFAVILNVLTRITMPRLCDQLGVSRSASLQYTSLVKWTEGVISRLSAVFPDNDCMKTTLRRVYLPHMYYVLAANLVHEDNEDRLVLLENFGLCC